VTLAALEQLQWSTRSVRITDAGGGVAFACEHIEAPAAWSNLAVAVVARRYFARGPDGASERSIRALIVRVIATIASGAQENGQVADPGERDAPFDELAALVLTQRATFATPVWLNAGLAERPLTSACFILKAEDSIPDLLDWNTREGLIFPAGRRRRNQPVFGPLLARARIARRRGERAGLVHARHRRVGRDHSRQRSRASRREDGRARRLAPRHPRVHRGRGARGGARAGLARRRLSARGGGVLARVPARPTTRCA